MAQSRDDVREIVNPGKADPKTPRHRAGPGSAGSAAGATGAGGGLPDNPEARGPGDFGPGGSAGPGASADAMQSRGDNGVRVDPRGAGRSASTAVDPGEESENLGARPPGRNERDMRNKPTNREQQDNTGVPS